MGPIKLIATQTNATISWVPGNSIGEAANRSSCKSQDQRETSFGQTYNDQAGLIIRKLQCRLKARILSALEELACQARHSYQNRIFGDEQNLSLCSTLQTFSDLNNMKNRTKNLLQIRPRIFSPGRLGLCPIKRSVHSWWLNNIQQEFQPVVGFFGAIEAIQWQNMSYASFRTRDLRKGRFPSIKIFLALPFTKHIQYFLLPHAANTRQMFKEAGELIPHAFQHKQREIHLHCPPIRL